MRITAFIIFFSVFFFQSPAHAYVGPGLGLGALGVIMGIFVSIFFAIVGIFWYPLKRIIRKFRKEKLQSND